MNTWLASKKKAGAHKKRTQLSNPSLVLLFFSFFFPGKKKKGQSLSPTYFPDPQCLIFSALGVEKKKGGGVPALGGRDQKKKNNNNNNDTHTHTPFLPRALTFTDYLVIGRKDDNERDWEFA